MKSTWLTVPELAAVLKLSMVSVHRAYWKGLLPAIRLGGMARFDLDQVRAATQRNGHHEGQTVDNPEGATRRARGGVSRRRDVQESPRLVNRCNNKLRNKKWTVRYLTKTDRAPANESSGCLAIAHLGNEPDLRPVADLPHDLTGLTPASPAHNSA